MNGEEPSPCLPCPGVSPLYAVNESSHPNASVCYPGIVEVYVVNRPPIKQGYSVNDVIVINFTRPTFQPVDSHVVFSPNISDLNYKPLWIENGQVLELTMTNVDALYSYTGLGGKLAYETYKNASSTAPYLNVTVFGAQIFDQQKKSGSMNDTVYFPVTGSWGTPDIPCVITATAVNSGISAGMNAGDQLWILFNEDVSIKGMEQLRVLPAAVLDGLFTWSSRPWTNYTGE